MQRRMISYSMMICGVLAMVIGFSLLPSPSPSTAAPALQPSPRPTLPPVTILPASEPTPVPMGRVTGTIIDLRTSAPAPGIAVQIGDAVVYSDTNGNYDRWVESGFYSVTLQLTADQGAPGQPPLAIAVGPGDTVVAHLFFTSPSAVETIAPPTIEEVPTAVVLPVLPEAPVSIPPKLPFTGVDAEETAQSSQQPAYLPRTATPIPFNAQFWFALGLLLLVSGLGLQFWPNQRPSRPARRRRMPTHRSDEELLRALLMQRIDRE